MSWHTISVKPRGGPPTHIWLENEWYKIDSVGGPAVLEDGTKEYRVVIQRDNVNLRQKGYRWYIEGSGPDDAVY